MFLSHTYEEEAGARFSRTLYERLEAQRWSGLSLPGAGTAGEASWRRLEVGGGRQKGPPSEHTSDSSLFPLGPCSWSMGLLGGEDTALLPVHSPSAGPLDAESRLTSPREGGARLPSEQMRPALHCAWGSPGILLKCRFCLSHKSQGMPPMQVLGPHLGWQGPAHALSWSR